MEVFILNMDSRSDNNWALFNLIFCAGYTCSSSPDLTQRLGPFSISVLERA